MCQKNIASYKIYIQFLLLNESKGIKSGAKLKEKIVITVFERFISFSLDIEKLISYQ